MNYSKMLDDQEGLKTNLKQILKDVNKRLNQAEEGAGESGSAEQEALIAELQAQITALSPPPTTFDIQIGENDYTVEILGLSLNSGVELSIKDSEENEWKPQDFGNQNGAALFRDNNNNTLEMVFKINNSVLQNMALVNGLNHLSVPIMPYMIGHNFKEDFIFEMDITVTDSNNTEISQSNVTYNFKVNTGITDFNPIMKTDTPQIYWVTSFTGSHGPSLNTDYASTINHYPYISNKNSAFIVYDSNDDVIAVLKGKPESASEPKLEDITGWSYIKLVGETVGISTRFDKPSS